MSTPLRILAINPGSTSTKLAVFSDHELDWQEVIRHSDAELAALGTCLLDQVPFRLAAIEHCLAQHDVSHEKWSAVAARGGLLPPLASGTYLVNDAMLAELRAARRGEHASNLGAFLAHTIAERASCQALIVDPVSVDELDDVARVSGLAGLERACLSHALNTKAIAKQFAQEQQHRYEQLRLIVAHLGSGISVSAHRDGRMVDVNNSREEGPFSTERSGGVPVLALLQRAISEHWSLAEADRRLFREGGIYSYLGTRDVERIVNAADAGDGNARLVLAAMLYQVRKEIGAMAAVLEGRVDAILLTGGMARSERITDALATGMNWIAPVHVYPGEDELRALAQGALRALRHEEELKVVRQPATFKRRAMADQPPTPRQC